MTESMPYRCADIALFLVLSAWLSASPVRADESDLRYQGFASQRLTASSGINDFFGETAGKLSADYTEVGAGLSWRPRSQWLLAGQAIYRRGGRSEEKRVESDYLYAAYTPLESEAGHLTLKLGKIKVPYGLYNDMRDTPMTRPGILAPQSIYLDSLRQFNQSASGIHLEAERALGDSALTLRLSQIKPHVSGDNAFWAFLGDRGVFKGELYTRDNEAFAGQLAYDHDGGRWRVLASHAQGIAHYRPGVSDIWNDGRLDFKFSAISLQWNGERVSLSGEWARNNFKFDIPKNTAPTDFFNHDIGDSWYLQGQWRFAPRWEALLRYDENVASNDDRDGAAFAAAKGKPAWMRFAKDWTVGVRYRVDRRWLLAAEAHRVHGIAWLPAEDNLSGGAWDPFKTSPRWNLLLLQATYQF